MCDVWKAVALFGDEQCYLFLAGVIGAKWWADSLPNGKIIGERLRTLTAARTATRSLLNMLPSLPTLETETISHLRRLDAQLCELQRWAKWARHRALSRKSSGASHERLGFAFQLVQDTGELFGARVNKMAAAITSVVFDTAAENDVSPESVRLAVRRLRRRAN